MAQPLPQFPYTQPCLLHSFVRKVSSLPSACAFFPHLTGLALPTGGGIRPDASVIESFAAPRTCLYCWGAGLETGGPGPLPCLESTMDAVPTFEGRMADKAHTAGSSYLRKAFTQHGCYWDTREKVFLDKLAASHQPVAVE